MPRRGGSQLAGRSILEHLWIELMTICDRLYTGAEAEDGRDPGRAEGVAYCIAVMTNPYQPDIQAVRTEVARRWKEENDER
jgi:hypothetical protein